MRAYQNYLLKLGMQFYVSCTRTMLRKETSTSNFVCRDVMKLQINLLVCSHDVLEQFCFVDKQ